MPTPLSKRFKVIPAVYIIFRDGDKVLLLKRANTGYYDGSYSLPGGHVDGNEPAILAAVREAHEEVGANVTKQELQLAHVMHRSSEMPAHHERVDFYFQTSKIHLELTNCEPDKCAGLSWFLITRLPSKMAPEVRHGLQKIAAGEFYSDFQFEKASF